MRLWSLHPRYLDSRGLVALWREALLAKRVVSGLTRGYRHHPQLIRFITSGDPESFIEAYLMTVYEESVKRGFRFDKNKLSPVAIHGRLTVTKGQLLYEMAHLEDKLSKRSPFLLPMFESLDVPDPHPLFTIIPGTVEPWEKQRPHNVTGKRR